jgi:hypothetical protein
MTSDTKFKKGDKRPANAGRKKGTPNKSTAELREVVKGKLGVDVLEELCDRYLFHKERENDTNADRMLTEIASYCLPKLKAIEHSGEVKGSEGVVITVEKIDIEDRVKQLKGEK